MPTEWFIFMLATVLTVALAMMAALSGLARRGDRRLPDVLGERTFWVTLTDTVARQRPIYLKARSSRAPPTFPIQSTDRPFCEFR